MARILGGYVRSSGLPGIREHDDLIGSWVRAPRVGVAMSVEGTDVSSLEDVGNAEETNNRADQVCSAWTIEATKRRPKHNERSGHDELAYTPSTGAAVTVGQVREIGIEVAHA